MTDSKLPERRPTACDDVLEAWTVEGRHPATHRAAQQRLRKEWPVLAGALDRLAAEARNRPKNVA